MSRKPQDLEARTEPTPRLDLRGHAGYRVTVRLETNGNGYEPTMVRGPSDVHALMQDLESETSECMYEVLLNARHAVVGIYEVSRGTTDSTLVDPKEVFRPAILSNAVGLILVHNHPSGDPSPSREDAAVTNQMNDACRLLGFTLLDHIIIGESGRCVSFADEGLMPVGPPRTSYLV